MSNEYNSVAASESSRQHNGNIYNYYPNNYPAQERSLDDALWADDRNRALLKAAAEDVDTGLTALHQAVLSGFEDVVDELISRGADINAKSMELGSPICFAALKARRNIFDLLLSRRSSLEAGMNFGSLAHAACCGGDRYIVEALQNRGCSFVLSCEVNANRMAEMRSSDVSALMKKWDIRIWMDCLPIHVAAFFGHTDIVQYLLDFSGPIRATYSEISATGSSNKWRRETGYTTLMAAAYSESIETIRLLMDCGVDVSAKTTPSGATALWIAASLGRASLIPFLVDIEETEEFENQGTHPTALAVLLQQAATIEKRLEGQRRRNSIDSKAYAGQGHSGPPSQVLFQEAESDGIDMMANSVPPLSTEDQDSISKDIQDERDGLRNQVSQLQGSLESLRVKYDEEISGVREELKEANFSKSKAELQYQNLLGKVNQIRQQLGERLKLDAAELDSSREMIEKLERSNSRIEEEKSALQERIAKLNSDIESQSSELQSLRSRNS